MSFAVAPSSMSPAPAPSARGAMHGLMSMLNVRIAAVARGYLVPTWNAVEAGQFDANPEQFLQQVRNVLNPPARIKWQKLLDQNPMYVAALAPPQRNYRARLLQLMDTWKSVLPSQHRRFWLDPAAEGSHNHQSIFDRSMTEPGIREALGQGQFDFSPSLFLCRMASMFMLSRDYRLPDSFPRSTCQLGDEGRAMWKGVLQADPEFWELEVARRQNDGKQTPAEWLPIKIPKEEAPPAAAAAAMAAPPAAAASSSAAALSSSSSSAAAAAASPDIATPGGPMPALEPASSSSSAAAAAGPAPATSSSTCDPAMVDRVEQMLSGLFGVAALGGDIGTVLRLARGGNASSAAAASAADVELAAKHTLLLQSHADLQARHDQLMRSMEESMAELDALKKDAAEHASNHKRFVSQEEEKQALEEAIQAAKQAQEQSARAFAEHSAKLIAAQRKLAKKEKDLTNSRKDHADLLTRMYVREDAVEQRLCGVKLEKVDAMAALAESTQLKRKAEDDRDEFSNRLRSTEEQLGAQRAVVAGLEREHSNAKEALAESTQLKRKAEEDRDESNKRLRATEEQLEQKEEQLEHLACIACMEERASVVYLPCACAPYCDACDASYQHGPKPVAAAAGPRTCPKCRAVITRTAKLRVGH